LLFQEKFYRCPPPTGKGKFPSPRKIGNPSFSTKNFFQGCFSTAVFLFFPRIFAVRPGTSWVTGTTSPLRPNLWPLFPQSLGNPVFSGFFFRLLPLWNFPNPNFPVCWPKKNRQKRGKKWRQKISFPLDEPLPVFFFVFGPHQTGGGRPPETKENSRKEAHFSKRKKIRERRRPLPRLFCVFIHIVKREPFPPSQNPLECWVFFRFGDRP